MYKFNKHHILPKSRFYETTWEHNFNIPNNMINLKVDVHNALHRLFSNKHFKEQIHQMYEMNRWIISKEVEMKLIDLFTMSNEDFYDIKTK